MGGTVTDPALVPASGTQPSGGREDSGEDSDEGCWDNFWGNYWHYLTNHGDMDRDLEVGETVGVGMIAVGSGGLAGIGAGTVVGGMLVDAGMGCELATAIGSLLGSGVGSEVGREIGQGLDGDTAGMIGEVGGGILGGMIDPVCFAAGTPVLTPEGTKAIEQIKVGDLVLSLPEDDPNGPVVAKRVEEVFERSSVLFDLHVGGKLIRTTAEHPFYVQGKGWTAAKSLVSGDLLRSHDGQWVPVESTCDSGEIAPVYNMRVEEFHTYFVGSAEWGFSVWVHNTCKVVDTNKLVPDSTGRGVFDPAKLERHGPFDWNKYTPIEVQIERGQMVIKDGLTRIENARRAGITQLPANIWTR